MSSDKNERVKAIQASVISAEAALVKNDRKTALQLYKKAVNDALSFSSDFSLLDERIFVMPGKTLRISLPEYLEARSTKDNLEKELDELLTIAKTIKKAGTSWRDTERAVGSSKEQQIKAEFYKDKHRDLAKRAAEQEAADYKRAAQGCVQALKEYQPALDYYQAVIKKNKKAMEEGEIFKKITGRMTSIRGTLAQLQSALKTSAVQDADQAEIGLGFGRSMTHAADLSNATGSATIQSPGNQLSLAARVAAGMMEAIAGKPKPQPELEQSLIPQRVLPSSSQGGIQ